MDTIRVGRQLFDGLCVSLSQSDSPLRDSRCNGRRAVDRNRFRCRAGLEKESVRGMGWTSFRFWLWDLLWPLDKDRLSKNLTGALQIDRARCTLSAGLAIDTRIPAASMM